MFERFMPEPRLIRRRALRMLRRDLEGEAGRQAPERHHDSLRDVAEGVVGAGGMLLALATPMLRRYRSHWGVEEDVAAREYPGDELIPTPQWQWTHGVEIDAPPDEVWPWVAQLGQDRGGFYSYQFLENLAGCDIQNAGRVHPEWGELVPGRSELKLHSRIPGIPIVGVESGRWLLAHGRMELRTGKEAQPAAPREEEFVDVTWLFFIEPLDGGRRSRFISRFRSHHGDALATRLLYGPALVEPVGFVMDRRMLLGVKQHVEQARRRVEAGQRWIDQQRRNAHEGARHVWNEDGRDGGDRPSPS
jgi:hypothetical protein